MLIFMYINASYTVAKSVISVYISQIQNNFFPNYNFFKNRAYIQARNGVSTNLKAPSSGGTQKSGNGN